MNHGISNAVKNISHPFINSGDGGPLYLAPQALLGGFGASTMSAFNGTGFNTTSMHPGSIQCGRINIMGSIVEESAPYLFPSIIEYSLIGAAVMYVMWRHIGYNPR